MLDILQRSYKHEFPEWETKIKEMIPSFGQKLAENPELYKEVKADVEHYLKLNNQK